MIECKKLFGTLTLTFLIFIILSQTVLAWGILPSKQLAELTTDTQKLSITLKNTNFEEGFFVLEFSGDLAEYASYDGDIIYLSADVSEKTTDFTLDLPAELEPGKRSLLVVLKEVTSKDATVTVNSLLTLVGEVVVSVPYEGNYVSAQLFIDSVPSSGDTPITISLVNKGDEEVVVYADIIIRSPTNTILSQWSTEEQVLDYLNAGKIKTSWVGEKEQGIYLAEVTLHYGDKTTLLRKEFSIGTKEIISVDVSAKKFTLGDIIPLEVVALNLWNEKIADVSAELFVLPKEGQLLQKFKTVSEDILGNSKTNLLGYWDTSNLLVGYYDLNVVMNYDGGETQKQYPVQISLDEMKVITSPTALVIEDDNTETDKTSLFIILLLVLIGLNVVIILYFKRMKKSGGKS